MRYAQQYPLLVLFEDVHWSDDLSLEFILHLARRCGEQRILLILTYRGDELHPPLRALLTYLERERLAHEIVLSRLSHDDVAAMIRAIFDLDRPVRPEFLDPVSTLTEGNPFFVEEILKALIARGDIFYGDDAWDRKPTDELAIPRRISDAVQRRGALVSTAARQALPLASIAGQRFSFVLQALAELDEASLLAVIKELSAAQLVIEESADRFAFRHALTRQAIYGGLWQHPPRCRNAGQPCIRTAPVSSTRRRSKNSTFPIAAPVDHNRSVHFPMRDRILMRRIHGFDRSPREEHR